MFTFLTRLGRLAIGIPVAVVVITVLGYTTLTMLPVSHHQATPGAGCVVSSSGVGQELTVAGRGFSAGTQYLLYLTSPGGNGATTVNTDSSGAFSFNTWAYWHGTYGASVWTEGGGSKEVAACASLTL